MWSYFSGTTHCLDYRPHPWPHLSIRKGWSRSTCQTSKILWHAASFPNEVHFSCKMYSVRGGILLAILLAARAQHIPPPPLGLTGRGGSVVWVTVTCWHFREAQWRWGTLPCIPGSLPLTASLCSQHAWKPEASTHPQQHCHSLLGPSTAETGVEGVLYFHLKPSPTLPSTATPAPVWPKITVSP